MTTAGDNFNRADSVDLGVNWAVATGQTNAQIVSNRVRAVTVGDANESQELYTPYNFSPNQQVSISIPTFTGATDVRAGVIARADRSANTRYKYYALRNFGGGETSTIEKVVSGVNSILASNFATTWGSGDTLIGIVQGSNLASLRNGSSLLTAIDTAIQGGPPGVIIYVGAGGSLANDEIDDWNARDFDLLDYTDFPPISL